MSGEKVVNRDIPVSPERTDFIGVPPLVIVLLVRVECDFAENNGTEVEDNEVKADKVDYEEKTDFDELFSLRVDR